MIINLPLQFKQIQIPEFNVRNYIDCYKASERSSDEFNSTINALLYEKMDIYSLILIMLEWRGSCISDKPFQFGSKQEIPPERLLKEITDNFTNFVKDYPIGQTKPYFHTWEDIGKDIISYSSSEYLSNKPASYLSEHLKWCNKNYNKDNYHINIYKNINLYPDKEYLFEFYISLEVLLFFFHNLFLVF